MRGVLYMIGADAPGVDEAVWDAWAPASEHELLQLSYLVMGRSDGVVYVVYGELDHSRDLRRFAAAAKPPGTEIRPVSARRAKREAQMRKAMPERAWAACRRARIVRNRDGSSLRDEIERGVGRPLRGRERADADVLEVARDLVRDPEHPAKRALISMAELGDDDVVEELDLPPFRIQGESE
jgi:hypothetical protein